MPVSNTTAPMGQGAPDTQALITLLSSLMPLLQRMQSQLGLAPQPGAWSTPGALNGMSPGTMSPSTMSPGTMSANDVADHQAALSFVEDITADSLRNLTTYLDAQAEQHPELGPCVTLVAQAARSSAMRDFNQAFELIWQAYRIIAVVRANNPQLPPLRPTGRASAESAAHH
jgi:hypothetical protein